MVSGLNLGCSIITRPLKERLMLYELDNWCRKKNPWVNDGDDDKLRRFKWPLAKNTRLTRKKNGESALTQTSRCTSAEKGNQCSIGSTYAGFSKPGEPRFLGLLKMDRGPHAYEDDHRTLSYNLSLRGYLSAIKRARRIARSFFTEMIVNGAIPDVVTFSILIRYYCKYFKYQCILDVVYTQMKALGVDPDDTFYKNLIYGVCARFGPNVGYRLLQELRSDRGIQMPLSCYNAGVRHFGKKSTSITSTNVLELIDALMDMKQQPAFP